jgi:hypothetical protein
MKSESLELGTNPIYIKTNQKMKSAKSNFASIRSLALHIGLASDDGMGSALHPGPISFPICPA